MLVWLVFYAFLQGDDEARLTDTRLPVNQNDPPFAVFDLVPASAQKIEFFFAADQLGASGAQGLETACDCTFAGHLPRHRRIRRGFSGGGAKGSVAEQIANQTPGGHWDDEPSRLGARKQIGRQGQCLTDR